MLFETSSFKTVQLPLVRPLKTHPPRVISKIYSQLELSGLTDNMTDGKCRHLVFSHHFSSAIFTAWGSIYCTVYQ